MAKCVKLLRNWVAALTAALTVVLFTQATAIAQRLDETWALTVNGQSVQVNSNGTFRVPNIAAPDQFGADGPPSLPDFLSDGFLRLSGLSTVGGVTRYVFSDPFQIRPGEPYRVRLRNLTFTDIPPPLPDSIRAVPDNPTLTNIGQTTQVRVTATLHDGSTTDVTPRARWTSYRTSNPSVATVDQNGLVTARAKGMAFITAVNEGATSVCQIDASPGDPLTTVRGYVQTTNGTPIIGARVTLIGLAVAPVLTGADGSFVITGVPTGLGNLVVSAVFYSTNLLTGLTAMLTPVPGGLTDAGLIALQPGFHGMVWIPRGTFLMGSPTNEAERGHDEIPHLVTLTKGIWMGQYEVTQAEYLDVIGSNPSYFTNGPAPFPGSGGAVTNELRHPVEQVTWFQAIDYCARLTQREVLAGRIPEGFRYRLPTEAEWEYACRAGTTNAFHYGPALRSQMANFNARTEYDASVGSISNPTGTNLARTAEVGGYAPNAFGLYDMHGNVSEWCQDWYGAYPMTPVTDPQGPLFPGLGIKEARGGAWVVGGSGCRSASRGGNGPVARNFSIGFRVVLDGDPLTTVRGYVQTTNGTPVIGATVTLVGLAVAPVFSGADGSFVIPEVPTVLGDLVVIAVLYSTNLPLSAFAAPLTPVQGGQTDAGLMVLEGVPGMVWIPPGTFLMGSPTNEAERTFDEIQHQVTLTQGIWMGQYEVTQAKYLDVIGSNPSYFTNGRAPSSSGSGGVVTNGLRHPVEQVNWIEATNYCARLTQREVLTGRIPVGFRYRLPTEAEWEYACRAGTTNALHYGPALRSGMANFQGKQEYDASVGTIGNPFGLYLGRTAEVGSYAPNAFGLYDMHGNVWEWCQDEYGAYPTIPVTDPQGPDSVPFRRVYRGGGWFFSGYRCRSALRDDNIPGSRDNLHGFRVVLVPGQP